MSKVQCEYCNSWIDDIDEMCPNCGAPNIHHKRVAEGTPATIEQLQKWYRDRNLPPEEVTRFFIGRDIKEPKAFGIFKDARGNVTVYKNKADGQRAIRYQGNDEEYAVNEIYLKLKEEILQQKSGNLNRGNQAAQNPYANNAKNPVKGKKRRKSCLIAILTPFILLGIFLIVGSILLKVDESKILENYYYLGNDNELYYYDGQNIGAGGSYVSSYDWYRYDRSLGDWEIFAQYAHSNEVPDVIVPQQKYSKAEKLAEKAGWNGDSLAVEYSKTYIDNGHHDSPAAGYYVYDRNFYYYLNDSNWSYGNKKIDQTGWYRLNKDNSEWEFFCLYNEQDKVPEGLWYFPDDYREYSYSAAKDVWKQDAGPGALYLLPDFEDTSIYEDYEANEEAWDDYYQENYAQENDKDDSWDSDWGDSGYDWDSNDSWDSGDTDWNSDW